VVGLNPQIAELAGMESQLYVNSSSKNKVEARHGGPVVQASQEAEMGGS
jgi:hypothetical protein